MLPVQPWGRGGAQEELRAVRVGAGVGHAEDARSVVLQLEVLVVKGVAVDGLSSGAVAGGEIATLAHELRDDAMEDAALEVQWLSTCPHSFFTCARGRFQLARKAVSVLVVDRCHLCFQAQHLRGMQRITIRAGKGCSGIHRATPTALWKY